MGGWALGRASTKIIVFPVFAAGTRNVTGPGGSAYQQTGLPIPPQPHQPPTPAGKHVKVTEVFKLEPQTSVLIQLQQNLAFSGFLKSAEAVIVSESVFRLCRFALVDSCRKSAPLARRT